MLWNVDATTRLIICVNVYHNESDESDANLSYYLAFVRHAAIFIFYSSQRVFCTINAHKS